MAAGAVPIVFGAAGPAEIVRDGVDGLHWSTLDQLAELTVDVAGDDARRLELSEAAQVRARDFSADAFADRLRSILSADQGSTRLSDEPTGRQSGPFAHRRT